MKEILEEYGSMILAAAGGGLLFALFSGIIWGDSSLFISMLLSWQGRGL